MSPVNLRFPDHAESRGPGYWLRARNLWAGRHRLRSDFSNEWRYEHLRTISAPVPPPGCDLDPDARSRSVDWLIDRPLTSDDSFRCVILGDTGEGDHSQYGLVPLIRHLAPDFVIINGDIAYPAGRVEDFEAGFFRPYDGLGVPVWAVPGNHEYYSPNRGREFHEYFCSETRRAEWDAAGLVLKPQPASFWELDAPAHRLVILGVDSGQHADLDGGKRGILGLGRQQPKDTTQHNWLDWRLKRAGSEGKKAIVLFHIPALVDERRVDVHLTELHRVLAKHTCVRAVIAAHEHNYQRYAPEVFSAFVQGEFGTGALPKEWSPTYFVSGAGGAYITSTDFSPGKYSSACLFPDKDGWKKWATQGRKIVAGLKLERSVINRISVEANKFVKSESEEVDGDLPEFLSLLLLECDANGCRLQPYFLADLAAMYDASLDGTTVDVMDRTVLLRPDAITACAKGDGPIEIRRAGIPIMKPVTIKKHP